ncbi:MAG: transcription termination factor Rho [Deltaproteobacteria bacterium]|nr:transcription termination factor Rho [Deltaproteobacteria bacterium]
MATSDKKEGKEKPLEKMTATELRELGMTVSELTGVHGMNKAELIAAIKKVRGIEEETAVKGHSVRDLKERIRALKQEKIKLQKEGADRKTIDWLRRNISHLKKMTRRAA